MGVGFVWANGTAAISSTGSINDATAGTTIDIAAVKIDLDAGTGIGNTEQLELDSKEISADTTAAMPGCSPQFCNEAGSTRATRSS